MKHVIRWLLCCCMIGIVACHKKKDGNLYTTYIAIAHFVPNADSISVLYDEQKTGGSRALSYGTATAQNGLAYLALGGGSHNMRILSGTATIKNNIYAYRAGTHYSLFLYDSLKAGTIKTALIQDAVSPVDTLAQVRFINMIADASAIQIVFEKDVAISTSEPYLGSKTSLTYAFSTLRAGSWKVSLRRNNAVIVQPAPYELQNGKLYSFVAKGVKGASGVYAESLLLMKHN